MRVAEVLGFERVTTDGVTAEEVRVDPGDSDAARAEHWAPPGDDSAPLNGDFAQLVESEFGSGGEAAVGYGDQTTKMAGQGEKRIYARSQDGAVVAAIWLKSDGTIEITNSGAKSFEMAPNGDVTIRGNLLVEGEVTAKSATPGTAVKLSTHVHPSPVGPTGAPTPGT